jgi:hypothetical protein
MAILTPREKSKIRLYLGHPDGYRFQNTRLESILNNLSEEAHELLRECLEHLATVETAIVSGTSSPISAAGIKRVDEIWFFESKTGGTSGGFASLKEAGRFYVGRISIITGVPVAGNAFGGSFAGDSFAPGNGGGNAFPFG